MINELEEREEAAVEPLEQAEPEPVTVTLHVGLDAELRPLAVVLAEEKRKRRRERRRREAAA